MRKLIAACAAAAAMAITAGAGTVAANAGTAAAARPAGTPGAPFCGIRWGSDAKHAGQMVRSPVRRVRAGGHACFDRLVIELGAGKRPGYRVSYVSRIIQDPSGRVIPVRGGARLRVTVLAPATRAFPIGSRHLVNVTGFRTFRQVVGAGSFEGITSLGLGVRARLPFRVFTLSGPGHGWRLVIDVAHRWSS